MSNLKSFFANYGFAISVGRADATHVTATYSPTWIEKYFANDFNKIDPIFRFAGRHYRRNAAQILGAREMASPLYEEARTHSADSNIMITDYFGGSTMVLGGVNHEMTEGSLREAVAACRLTHRQHIAQNINQLTDRQVELMELIEMGLRDSEICHELKVSKSAVAQRKRAICDCLGLTNFQTAAQIYTAQKWSGLIAP